MSQRFPMANSRIDLIKPLQINNMHVYYLSPIICVKPHFTNSKMKYWKDSFKTILAFEIHPECGSNYATLSTGHDWSTWRWPSSAEGFHGVKRDQRPVACCRRSPLSDTSWPRWHCTDADGHTVPSPNHRFIASFFCFRL